MSVALIMPLIAFWFWMGWDMNHNKSLTADERQRWAVVLLLFNVFGAGLYYHAEYRARH
jgi:hypothetical protein